jgi:hypothetical protein
MSDRIKAYIAGPYTQGDPEANTKLAMKVWHELWALGYAPFCPHLSHYLKTLRKLPYDDWLKSDMAWLECCDVLLRLPGESKGAEIEVGYCRDHDIPIVYDVPELLEAFPPHANNHEALRRGLERRNTQSANPHLAFLQNATDRLEAVHQNRGTVYGDVKENHEGIAAMWASLLQPHAKDIAAGKPIPAWAVCLMFCALKLNRMRRVYHQDNYDDLLLYAAFAAEMQEADQKPEK